MAETLPEDWEAQVARAYTTFGVDSAAGVDEFGILSKFPKLSVDFLRRKAEQQLRDRLGRWREERGHLDRDVEPFHAPHARDRLGAWASRQPVSMPRFPGVTEIPQDRAVHVLSRAGWTKARAQRWAQRGRVFSYSDDGQNAVYVFIADPKEAVAARVEPWVKRLEKAKEAKRVADERLASATKANPQAISALTSQATDAAKKVDDYTKGLEKEIKWWEKVHGYTPENTSEEYTQKLVEDAGRILRETISKSPEWKKNSTRSLMVEFDESVMIADPTQKVIVPAQSKRGGNVISLDRSQYFESTDILPDNWDMPTDKKYFGEYSIPHEVGHLVDELDTKAYWSSMEHRDVWIKAIQEGLMSTYGRGNPREGYAEAYAMWIHDPEHPVAKLYANEFQWDKPEQIRPGVDDVPLDENYWEAVLAEEAPDEFKTGAEEDVDPFAAAAPRRLVGTEAGRALHAAGYNANEAVLYGTTGEVFTRDGKVFSFHPYPTAAPIRRRAKDLRDEVRALKRNPRTNEPYQRLPANIKAQVQVLERQIRALDKQVETFPSKPKKLTAQNVRHAKIALRDMEAGLKKLPKWRDKSGPFMVEIDPDLMVPDVRVPMTLGQAVAGSNKIALNPQVYDPARQAISMIKDPREVVFHELGHVTDARPYDPGSSRSAGGIKVHDIAKTLEGMTTYGSRATQEGYAEMFAKWAAGDRDSPAVQFYARAFGWSASVRRNPTITSVDALARRMGVAALRRRDAAGSSWSRR